MNIKYRNIIFISIAIIIAALVLYRTVGNSPQEENSLSKQKSSLGAITVEVLPKTLAPSSQAVFEVVFDTHSAELNYEVDKIAQLTDDTGNNYKPVSWTGGKGGHHVEGILTFPDIAESARRVTLTIPGIDKQDRVFSWDLK